MKLVSAQAAHNRRMDIFILFPPTELTLSGMISPPSPPLGYKHVGYPTVFEVSPTVSFAKDVEICLTTPLNTKKNTKTPVGRLSAVYHWASLPEPHPCWLVSLVCLLPTCCPSQLLLARKDCSSSTCPWTFVQNPPHITETARVCVLTKELGGIYAIVQEEQERIFSEC